MSRVFSIGGCALLLVALLFLSGCGGDHREIRWVQFPAVNFSGSEQPEPPLELYLGFENTADLSKSKAVLEEAIDALMRDDIEAYLQIANQPEEVRKAYEYTRSIYLETETPEIVFSYNVGEWHFHVIPLRWKPEGEYRQWLNSIPMQKTEGVWKSDMNNFSGNMLNVRSLLTEQYVGDEPVEHQLKVHETLPMKDALHFAVPMEELGAGASVEVALRTLPLSEGLESGILDFARETRAMVEALEHTIEAFPEPLASRLCERAKAFMLPTVQDPEWDLNLYMYPLNRNLPVIVDAEPYWIVWVGEAEEGQLSLERQVPMIFKNLPEGEWQWVRFLGDPVNFFSSAEFCEAFAEALNRDGFANGYTPPKRDASLGSSVANIIKKEEATTPTLTLMMDGAEIEDRITLQCAGANPIVATAIGFTNDDQTENIEVAGNQDAFPPGEHRLTYSLSIEGELVASRDVLLEVLDKPPVLFLNGPEHLPVECGVPYREFGATAHVKCDHFVMDRSDSIQISGAVNVERLGSYTITYTLPMDDGPPVVVEREVMVVDRQAPTIRLLADSRVMTDAVFYLQDPSGGDFEDPGFVAHDTCDGELDSEAVMIDGEVDTSAVGRYELRYHAVDRSGNSSSTVSRMVHVVETIPSYETTTLHVGKYGEGTTYPPMGSYEVPRYDATSILCRLSAATVEEEVACLGYERSNRIYLRAEAAPGHRFVRWHPPIEGTKSPEIYVNLFAVVGMQAEFVGPEEVMEDGFNLVGDWIHTMQRIPAFIPLSEVDMNDLHHDAYTRITSVVGNGIPDLAEMMFLEKLLKDNTIDFSWDSGVVAGEAIRAYKENHESLLAQLSLDRDNELVRTLAAKLTYLVGAYRDVAIERLKSGFPELENLQIDAYSPALMMEMYADKGSDGDDMSKLEEWQWATQIAGTDDAWIAGPIYAELALGGEIPDAPPFVPVGE